MTWFSVGMGAVCLAASLGNLHYAARGNRSVLEGRIQRVRAGFQVAISMVIVGGALIPASITAIDVATAVLWGLVAAVEVRALGHLPRESPTICHDGRVHDGCALRAPGADSWFADLGRSVPGAAYRCWLHPRIITLMVDGDPYDECECGDYRHQHHDLGCVVCMHGTPPPDGADGCRRFRLAARRGGRAPTWHQMFAGSALWWRGP